MVGGLFLAVFNAKWRDDAVEISPAFFNIFLLNNNIKKKERKKKRKMVLREN